MTEAVHEYQLDRATSLAREVQERSGQNLFACYQCRKCAAGCPVAEETQMVTPDRLIRLILLGDREASLNNLLVWKCVACYTCGERCPNNIQTARITETLKQMAKSAHLEPATPTVAHFHDSFMTAAKALGRVNELLFMGIYETKNAVRDLKTRNLKGLYNELLAQARLGLPMMRKGRMHLGIDKVKKTAEIRRLFKKAGTRKK